MCVAGGGGGSGRVKEKLMEDKHVVIIEYVHVNRNLLKCLSERSSKVCVTQVLKKMILCPAFLF